MQKNISSFFSGSLKRKKQNVESCDAGQTANKKKFDVNMTDRHRDIKSQWNMTDRHRDIKSEWFKI